MKKEVKRHQVLEPLSKEHDHSLQVCSKIRKGLVNNVEPERIRSYTEWFKSTFLEPHFEVEEKIIFPVLGNNARVKRALANHRRILRLFNCSCEDEKVLNLLEEELSAYIRFEERILYNEIQAVATSGQLADIEKQHHRLQFNDEEWEDRFWVS